MSEIHEFKCDSCKETAKAHYNGEHYIFPAGWVELFNREVLTAGHLCAVCHATLWELNLRTTKVGKQVSKKVGP